MERKKSGAIKLVHGVSQKQDGPMSLVDLEGGSRVKFLKSKSILPRQTVGLQLKHSNKVATVRSEDLGTIIKNRDAAVTNSPGIFLTITVADCFPIFFYNSKKRVTGLAHSGWRGTVENIAGKTVKSLKRSFACNPRNLFVLLGPGIRSCHFEIKSDVLKHFKNYPEAIIYRNKKIFINLPKIIKQQLIKTGVPKANISDSKECTYCEIHKYFSFRRDHPKKLQAMLAFVGLIGKKATKEL